MGHFLGMNSRVLCVLKTRPPAKVPETHGLGNAQSFTGTAIRTAQFGNRDKRAPRAYASPKPAVSGSD